MLELKHICFTADEDGSRKEILKDISLTIDERFVAITGPNGGGKSTLIKIIAGVITPTSGQILLDGEDITHLTITERAHKGVSYAFQQPVRFKGITVYDLIQLASGRQLSISEACQYLSEVGMCARDYVNREVNASLSGGELKRIEIATILARSTKLSLFDEPEAGIDLWSFSMLVQQFEAIHKKKEQSLILISHQERIIQMADRIMVIEDGRIGQLGTTQEVLPKLMNTADSLACLKRNTSI